MPASTEAAGGFHVTVFVTRGKDGKAKVRTEPDAAMMEDVYVLDKTA
ncbi:MAG: hypothetical protein HY894_05845 [Deltaproteobacteria bacterium]|nr:hypothetical protein [Deltaproteobacteria bacterium]